MTQNLVKNIIGNVASSYQVNLAIGNANMTENYINSNISLVDIRYLQCLFLYVTLLGSFFDWTDIFLIGRAQSKSECVGKTRYEISYRVYKNVDDFKISWM